MFVVVTYFTVAAAFLVAGLTDDPDERERGDILICVAMAILWPLVMVVSLGILIYDMFLKGMVSSLRRKK